MPEDLILRLAKQTLETVLLVSAPMLGAGLIVGVIISILQVITSIHDTALAFVPRIVVTFVVFLIVFPWMMGKMVSYTYTLLGSFSPNTAVGLNVGLYRTFMIIGGIGTILTAGYFLWMLQRVNQGEAPVKWKDHHFRDILAVEWVSWVPLLALTLVLGLIPSLILDTTATGVDAIVKIVTG